MDDITSFGYWIRRRRKALDLTQEALAHQVGCSLGAIRKLEADERRPSPEMAQRLAQVLELSVEERGSFLKVARAELAPDQLAAPSESVVVSPRASRIGHGTVPVAATPLIGRTAEMAAVHAALEQPNVRLLTLTGMGGVGKTRLALAVATAMQHDVADGAAFVDLAPIRDPALVLATIAVALGVTERREEPLLATLQAHLSDKHLLLVLDNFEQVVAAAPLLAEVLAAAPRLRILVTSREVLHLSGEHVFPVPPLTLPDRQAHPSLERLTEYDAVRLFIARAQAAQASFALTAANAAAVSEMCHRLDGLPLAIELAAARVRLLPPQTLLARLTNRLGLLTGGARDLPARHLTLRSTLDWSYDLLPPGEQALFARLGVFVGGAGLEAAEAVCSAGEDPQIDVLDGLASLVDKSLAQQAAGPVGEPRLTMLETLRDYALERLEEYGEAELLRRTHAHYYRTLGETAEPGLRSVDQAAWIERLEAEHENLRTALQWFAASDEVELGLQLAGALWRFWAMRGYVSEGHQHVTALLAQMPMAQPSLGRAKALFCLGVLSLNWDTDEGAPHFEQSAALFGSVGDRWGRACALGFLTIVAWFSPEASSRGEECVALFRALGDRWGLAFSRVCEGFVAASRGDYAAAYALGTDGAHRLRDLGDPWTASFAMRTLGAPLRREGDLTRVAALWEEAVVLSRDAGDMPGMARSLGYLGMVTRWQGDHRRAAVFYDESIALFQELKLSSELTTALHGRGMVAYHLGDTTRAQVLLAESLRQFWEAGFHKSVGWCFEGLAGVAAQQGRGERAARLLAADDVINEHLLYQPDARDEWAGVAAVAQAQLDDATWERAWAEGRAMTLEQAIAYALSDET
ncbi:MAG: helix-turn-helix domain-containing protein [Chloroflexota bacterium]|nr:helix-turn-helix domain-containing protein [Chloroflexota bacterium]